MHCLHSQTCEYISKFVFDDNEKLLINEVLEVLIGVRTFTSTSSFDMQSIQFVTMNELNQFVTMNELSLLEFEATQHDVYRKMGQMYLSVVEQYFLVNVTRNLSITLIINTPSKSFSIGFTHFKYCF